MIKYHMSRRTFAGAGLGVRRTDPDFERDELLRTKPRPRNLPMGPFYPIVRPTDSDMDLTWVKGRNARAAGQVDRDFRPRVRREGQPDARAPRSSFGRPMRRAATIIRATSPSQPLDPNFQGFGALTADAKGEWRIVTIKPGGYDFAHRPSPAAHPLRHAFGKDAQRRAALFPRRGGRECQGHALQGAVTRPKRRHPFAARDASDPNKYSWDIVLLG